MLIKMAKYYEEHQNPLCPIVGGILGVFVTSFLCVSSMAIFGWWGLLSLVAWFIYTASVRTYVAELQELMGWSHYRSYPGEFLFGACGSPIGLFLTWACFLFGSSDAKFGNSLRNRAQKAFETNKRETYEEETLAYLVANKGTMTPEDIHEYVKKRKDQY